MNTPNYTPPPRPLHRNEFCDGWLCLCTEGEIFKPVKVNDESCDVANEKGYQSPAQVMQNYFEMLNEIFNKPQ